MVLDSNEPGEKADVLPSSAKELKKFLKSHVHEIDGEGPKFNLHRDNSIKLLHDKDKGDEKGSDDDFYGRLKNMYNKPPTNVSKPKEKIINAVKESNKDSTKRTKKHDDFISDIDSYASDLRKFLQKYPKELTGKLKCPTKAEDKVKYNRSKVDEVCCNTVHYEEPEKEAMSSINLDPDLLRKIGGIDMEYSDSDDNDPDDDFPSMEDLPDDPVELEAVFLKYVDKLGALADEMEKKGAKTDPGTKESVRSCIYKLDSLQEGKDPTEAVTGVRKCHCSDTIVIDGNTAQLKDVKLSVKELKTNHKIKAVEIKIKEGNHTIFETVDDVNKVKLHKGPVILTKYVMERLCSQISKHPCIEYLSIEQLPLTAPVQALLVPSYANLKMLKMVGTKLRDDGIFILCQYLWRSRHLAEIDFTDNGITKKGAEKLSKLIEKKGLYNVMEPNFVALQRLTLNKNPIGAEGMKSILRELGDDMFMKAVDLRNCDIETTATEVLDIIGKNFDLQVLDLRDNRVDRVDLIIKYALDNCPLHQSTYKWEDEDEIKKYVRPTTSD